MKCFVDISIKHSGGIRKGNGEGVVTIWTIVNGQRKESGPYTVSVEDESINALAIRSVNEALKHFKKTGQEIEIRTYRAVNGEKEVFGILTAWDDSSVTIEPEDGEEITFQKADISLIRMAFHF